MSQGQVKGIVSSVLACQFDEHACAAIEAQAATSSPSSVGILDKLLQSGRFGEETLTDQQAIVLFTYLRRFLAVFPAERLLPWQSLIFYFIPTSENELSKIVRDLCVDFMGREETFREACLRRAFECPSISMQTLLIAFAERDAKAFVQQLHTFLSDSSCRSAALELLNSVLARQGPTLHRIMDTPTLQTLMNILLADTEEECLIGAGFALVMLFPTAITSLSLPESLSPLFLILRRILVWDATHRSRADTGASGGDEAPRASIAPLGSILFNYLYSLFPCNLLKFLREETTTDEDVRKAVKPLLCNLRFHPQLLRPEDELSPEYWKKADPWDLVEHATWRTLGKRTMKGTNGFGGRRDSPRCRGSSDSSVHDQVVALYHGTQVWNEMVSVVSLPILDEGGSESDKKQPKRSLATLELPTTGLGLGNTASPFSTPPISPRHSTEDPPLPGRQELDVWDSELTGPSEHSRGISRTVSPCSEGREEDVGEQIVLLQNVIDRSLRVRGSVDYTTDMALVYGDNRLLRKHCILIRNELLFERYLLQRCYQRIRGLQRKITAAAAIEADRMALRNEIKQQAITIEKLKKTRESMQFTLTDLKERQRRWEAELQRRLRKMAEERQLLSEHNIELQEKMKEEKANMRLFSADAGEKNNRVLLLEGQVHEMAQRLEHVKEKDETIAALREDLRIWHFYHQAYMQTALPAFMQSRDTCISNLQGALKKAHRTIANLQSMLETKNNASANLETEKEHSMTALEQQKQILEHHKKMTREELAAMTERYQAVKDLNTSLKHKVMQLQGELSKRPPLPDDNTSQYGHVSVRPCSVSFPMDRVRSEGSGPDSSPSPPPSHE